MLPVRSVIDKTSSIRLPNRRMIVLSAVFVLAVIVIFSTLLNSTPDKPDVPAVPANNDVIENELKVKISVPGIEMHSSYSPMANGNLFLMS